MFLRAFLEKIQLWPFCFMCHGMYHDRMNLPFPCPAGRLSHSTPLPISFSSCGQSWKVRFEGGVGSALVMFLKCSYHLALFWLCSQSPFSQSEEKRRGLVVTFAPPVPWCCYLWHSRHSPGLPDLIHGDSLLEGGKGSQFLDSY